MLLGASTKAGTKTARRNYEKDTTQKTVSTHLQPNGDTVVSIRLQRHQKDGCTLDASPDAGVMHVIEVVLGEISSHAPEELMESLLCLLGEDSFDPMYVKKNLSSVQLLKMRKIRRDTSSTL